MTLRTSRIFSAGRPVEADNSSKDAFLCDVSEDFKATNFWAALVEEPANVAQDGAGMTLVTSLPENMAVIAVDAANARSGPSIASSVVGKLPYGTQVQIVGQSADWLKVKMPDQTEAWVAAGWIVAAGR